MSGGPPLTRQVKGGRKAFFDNADSDRLLAMLTRFMTEHWVLRERVELLEKLLLQKAVVSPEELEALRSQADIDQALDADSYAFIQSVVGAADNIQR